MKYRKKPVVIDAMWWDATLPGATAIIDWIVGNGGTARWHEAAHGRRSYIAIDTLEGTMALTHGNYVIQGVQGEFYPCKAEIFHATYEPVEAQS